jgi:hypothetical protein
MTEKEVVQIEKPDPEVKAPVQRRSFTEAEKLRILDEADACTERGEIGALVRREGIYRCQFSPVIGPPVFWLSWATRKDDAAYEAPVGG